MDKFNIIKKIVNRSRSLIFFVSVASATSLFTTSCEDFLDVDSNMIVDADKDHLSSARDSIYSVIGILNKLQAIADRTVLLGEARGDLVDINDNTSKDLRDLALFNNVGDDNKYNSPREYYAVINNCNYFIANVDTAMTNNRNENVFLNEYAVVKAIRAWTYLQLVTTYGKVPFITDPILSKDEGEKTYPMYDIQQICDYFINEDGLQELADNDNITYPSYGDIKGTPSRLFYIQLNLILGDLYLWRGSLLDAKDDYLNAAKCYYAYIRNRNGKTTSSAYPITAGSSEWLDYSSWDEIYVNPFWINLLVDESGASNSEVITIIPMDSVRSEGYYSELRGIFSSSYSDNMEVQLVPSESMKELSAAQEYCYYDGKAEKFFYAPKNLSNQVLDGDLRLASIWRQYENTVNGKGEHITAQSMVKYHTKNGNIHIYRRGQVYLRFAEAMNRAGFPRYAYHILASGVNNDVISNCIAPFLSEADSTKILEEFGFPTSTYMVATWRSDIPGLMYNSRMTGYNHMGIHSRGSGESAFNDYYKMPYGEAIIDTVEVVNENGELIGYKFNVHKDKETEGLVERQMLAVEEMIVDEMALETAFEGYRFYDLMRVAYRRHDPSYLAKKIYARKGSTGMTTIDADLNNTNNWFLRWNDKIGIY